MTTLGEVDLSEMSGMMRLPGSPHAATCPIQCTVGAGANQGAPGRGMLAGPALPHSSSACRSISSPSIPPPLHLLPTTSGRERVAGWLAGESRSPSTLPALTSLADACSSPRPVTDALEQGGGCGGRPLIASLSYAPNERVMLLLSS